MYIASVGVECNEAVFHMWMVELHEAALLRGVTIEHDVAEAWVGNVIINLKNGWRVKDIEQQLGLYAQGVGDARICDFMTILPFSSR